MLGHKESFQSSENAKIIKDYMFLIKNFPEILNRDDFVMNLLSLTKLQNQFAIEEVTTFISNHSAKLDPIKRPIINKLIQHAKNWDNLKLEAELIKYSTWEKIINLAKRNNADVVLMTYPLRYKSTNRIAREISKKHNIKLIDLEKIFESLKNRNTDKRYIDDWEHCTPEGYATIAKEVTNSINEIIKTENRHAN